jgi:hypothetical protein
MECTKHPDQHSMITCFECGRSFCRICNPPPKAGQYCPACYEKILAGFSEQSVSEKKAKEVKARASKPKGRSVGEKARKKADAVKNKTRETASNIASLPKKAVAGTRDYFKGRFPVTLVKKQELGTPPLFKAIWYKFAIIFGSGVTVWVIVTALAKQRNPLISLAVAIGVVVAVVCVLGVTFDITVAIFAVMLVLTTLISGELMVQVLIRLGVIAKLDTGNISLYVLKHPGNFYSTYFFKLIVWRMLPGVIVAFLIGLWPLPKRLSWKGFEQWTKEASGEPTS